MCFAPLHVVHPDQTAFSQKVPLKPPTTFVLHPQHPPFFHKTPSSLPYFHHPSLSLVFSISPQLPPPPPLQLSPKSKSLSVLTPPPATAAPPSVHRVGRPRAGEGASGLRLPAPEAEPDCWETSFPPASLVSRRCLLLLGRRSRRGDAAGCGVMCGSEHGLDRVAR